MHRSGMGREKRQGEENSEALPAMELPSTPPRPGSVTRIFSPRNLKTWCSGYVHEAPAGTTLAWTPLFSAGWEKGRGSPGELETNASVMTWASSLAAAAQSRCNPLSSPPLPRASFSPNMCGIYASTVGPIKPRTVALNVTTAPAPETGPWGCPY